MEFVQATAVEDRTRDRVMRALLEHGPATAATLASQLELTAAAVRRHLDVLVAEGAAEVRQPRRVRVRGRGRPAKLFALTDFGRSGFHHAYDDLAASALRFLASTAGDQAVLEFARAQVAELEVRHAATVAAAPPAQRARVLAQALSADGYAASTQGAPSGHGEQLCQHHCPVAHVAVQFPQLCEAETEMLSRLLGTHVQRLATIAHGDGVCTTFVPAPSGAGQPSPAQQSVLPRHVLP